MEETKVTCAADARAISEANVPSVENVLKRIGGFAENSRQIEVENWNDELMVSLARLGFNVSTVKLHHNQMEVLKVTW